MLNVRYALLVTLLMVFSGNIVCMQGDKEAPAAVDRADDGSVVDRAADDEGDGDAADIGKDVISHRASFFTKTRIAMLCALLGIGSYLGYKFFSKEEQNETEELNLE